MSEADRTWRVELDGATREIAVQHSTMTGRIVVTLDGAEVGRDRMLARRKKIPVPVPGHAAAVTVSFTYGGFAATSALHVDDSYVEPLRR